MLARRTSRALMLALALSTALPMVAAAQGAAGAPPAVQRVEKGNLVIEGVPEHDPRLAQRLRQYLSARSAAVLDWTADGSGLLIRTRFGESMQLHMVQQPLGARTQLTFADEPITSGQFRPAKGGELYFMQDVGGNEQTQIMRLDPASGQVQRITDGESRNSSPEWSRTADRMAFTSTKRNGKDFDIYVAPADGAGPGKLLVQVEGLWQVVEWAPDDKRLLLREHVSNTVGRLFIADAATGKLTRLKPDVEGAQVNALGFTADGKGVFYISNERGEFTQLGLLDLATGQTRWITENIPWDVESGELSRDGKTLAYVVNEGGWSTLHLLDTATLKPLPAPPLPKGTISGAQFSPDGKRLAVSLSRPTAPGDAYVLDLAANTVTQWTKSEVGGLNTDAFAETELIQYPTFDQVDGKPRTIPAFIYRPKNAPKGERLPVIIDFHGGPEAQWRPSFSAILQFFINEVGAVVIRPNVRGSDGYGKTFLTLDNGFLREDSVKDAGALLDWIAKQPDLDAKRVGVTGGSYGGYMVLASLVHYNDRLAGGVNTVGISHFATFLKNTADYRRDIRRAEYGDERDPKMLEFMNRIAPLNNANRITKPLLVVQGLNDPRVPVSEAEQIVAAVRKNGGEAWYVMAKDEGHGFAKRSNQFYGYMAEAMFFRKLFGKAPGG